MKENKERIIIIAIIIAFIICTEIVYFNLTYPSIKEANQEGMEKCIKEQADTEENLMCQMSYGKFAAVVVAKMWAVIISLLVSILIAILCTTICAIIQMDKEDIKALMYIVLIIIAIIVWFTINYYLSK